MSFMTTILTGERGELGRWLLANWPKEAGPLLPFDIQQAPPAGPIRLIHLAAKRPPASEVDLKRSNIDYLNDVILWARKHKVDEFIFFSSNSLYKGLNIEGVTETTPLLTSDFYSQTKRQGEQILEKAGLRRVLCVRIPGLLEISRPTSFMSIALAKIRSRQSFEFTNGHRLFNNYISLPDVMRFLCGVNLVSEYDIVNLAPEPQLPLKDLLRLLAEIAKAAIRPVDKGPEATFFNVSVEKLKNKYKFTCSEPREAFTWWLQAWHGPKDP